MWVGTTLLLTAANVYGADSDYFRKSVAPILERNCVTCHHDEKPNGGLVLTRRETAVAGGDSGAAIIPGEPAKTLLGQTDWCGPTSAGHSRR
jgi:hypothetical protein